MNDFLKRAEGMSEELLEMRRYLHQHAETGDDLRETVEYVARKLTEFGYEPKEICKSGVTAVLEGGKPGKALLLRADMDALRMEERSGLPFASKTGAAHSCGHDIHTTALLGAAKMLKEAQPELKGLVKLMFQPAEETLQGAETMIRAGVLENPAVDAAFGMHVASDYPAGCFGYNRGAAMASSDNFEIHVAGRSCHGAMPHLGADPINAACHIHTALQEIISREVNAADAAVLTVGQLIAGEAVNVIPGEAVLRGTVRTRSKQVRELMLRRMREIVVKVADAFNTEADVRILASCPPLVNDADMCGLFLEVAEGLGVGGVSFRERTSMGSEDFAFISDSVPSCFGFYGAGVADESKRFPGHNPNIIFDETCIPYGAAAYAAFAKAWLDKNS